MGYNLLHIKLLGSAYIVLILGVHFTSAGLLQAIREAAVPKDMDYQLPIEPDASSSVPMSVGISPSEVPLSPEGSLVSSTLASPVPQSTPTPVVTPSEETSLLSTLQTSISKLSSAIQERADVATTGYNPTKNCNPGDILCIAGISTGGGQMKNEISKAVIKSFGTMMSDMVNTTISRNLVEFMSKHGSAHGETLGEEHKAMVAMASNVLQTVSAKVIKSFTFFVQMAISGAMRDLLHTLMDGVTTAYNQHQKSMSELRSAAVLNGPPEHIPKPSQLQAEFDPVKTLLQAGALTSLSYPSSGFDLMSSLKSNLFTGETNSIEKKSEMAPVLTPYGLISKRR